MLLFVCITKKNSHQALRITITAEKRGERSHERLDDVRPMVKSWIATYAVSKDYCITGHENGFSVQLAFGKFLSKIKGNF